MRISAGRDSRQRKWTSQNHLGKCMVCPRNGEKFFFSIAKVVAKDGAEKGG